MVRPHPLPPSGDLKSTHYYCHFLIKTSTREKYTYVKIIDHSQVKIHQNALVKRAVRTCSADHGLKYESEKIRFCKVSARPLAPGRSTLFDFTGGEKAHLTGEYPSSITRDTSIPGKHVPVAMYLANRLVASVRTGEGTWNIL